MSRLSKKLKGKFFKSEEHPFYIFERVIEQYTRPEYTLLDAGCGRSAEILRKFKGKTKRLIGIDLVDFDPTVVNSGLELQNNDLANIAIADESVDVVISRSVMEHLRDPLPVYREMHRVLRRDGLFIFLTPNLGDYVSLVSKAIPNRFHPWVVSLTRKGKIEDTFPTYYRTNTYKTINRLAKVSGFELITFRYLGQYPAYFNFNPVLFLIATGYEKLISRFDCLKNLRGWLLVVLRSV